MGITAENVAKKYKISRIEQQEFALESHEKANYAQNHGNYKNEIVTVNNCDIDVNSSSLNDNNNDYNSKDSLLQYILAMFESPLKSFQTILLSNDHV